MSHCDWEWIDEAAGIARCRRCATKRRLSSLDARRACRAAATIADQTECIHRGEVARGVPCKSCNNSTIEVAVHTCALFGECTVDNHAHRNPDLSGVHVCRGCPSRIGNREQGTGDRSEVPAYSSPHAPREESRPADPALPSLVTRAKNYAGAMVRDRLAGKLRRSPELIARLFNDHCAKCPLYNRAEGACGKCGCPVSPTEPEANKLAWASENCPDGRWAIQRANLIFYLLPLRNAAGVWPWHVEQLRQRLSIFNGRRIVWIATRGPETKLNLDAPEAVIEAFGRDADSIEFVTAPNDPKYWETPAFRWMLRALHSGLSVEECKMQNAKCKMQNGAGAEASFYFHAKGVRRADQSAIRPWCEAIYHHNLDRWPEVRQILSVYPCAGVARQAFGPINRPEAQVNWPWHFAGTGFWFNHARLFARPAWDEIADHSHAIEAYLSTQFPYESAYCLAHENAGEDYGGVYKPSTWLDPRAQDRPPAIHPAGASREAPRDLELWLLGHDREKLRWAAELPWVRKIYLPDLDPSNDWAESRVFHHPPLATRHPPPTYIGLCTQSWDRKYRGQCLPLAELDRLERRPDRVWAAWRGEGDWLAMSETDHPGMRAVLEDLIAHLGLSAEQIARPQIWANNLIAHRDVIADLAAFHRPVREYLRRRWGERPPYDSARYKSAHGGGGATRHLSFLGERITLLYFQSRADLEVRQIPAA